jgi:peptidoglycan hydrolase-like protein with peptidoglycan-binding domain
VRSAVHACQRPLLLAALLCAASAAYATGTAIADDPAAPAGGGASSASDEGVLERGDRGEAVRSLQQALGIAADGVFGKQTAQAVKRFQRSKGLTVDGVVGPQTRAALGLRPVSSSLAEDDARPVRLPRALRRIAECESGGDPTAISPSGRYRGKYQFSRPTWRAMGGAGDPAEATEAEQDRRALKLFRLRGSAPWPSCGG